MKVRKKVPYSFLFEIYGGQNANLSERDNCFAIFNPMTSRSKDYYIEKWTNITQKFFRKVIELEAQNSKGKNND